MQFAYVCLQGFQDAILGDSGMVELIGLTDILQRMEVEEVEDIKMNLRWKRGQSCWHLGVQQRDLCQQIRGLSSNLPSLVTTYAMGLRS